MFNTKHKLRSLLCIILSAAIGMTAAGPSSLSGGTSAEAASASEETADYSADTAIYSDDEIIIVYKDEALSTNDDTLEEAGVVSQEEITTAEGDGAEDDGTAVVAQLDDGVSVEEAVESLEDDPDIAYVQPNYSYSLLTTEVSDPYADEDSASSQYYLYSSYFTDAWDYSKTEGSVTVAVIDTGCNLLHEDLTDTVNADLAYDATTGTLLSESNVDNNGDALGHGTYVCGIIAGTADNATGIAGASYNANILPVKVFDDDGVCTTSDLLSAYSYLSYLIDSGELSDLKVINMSLGYYSDGTTQADELLESAIASMLDDYGVLTVCAGGNGADGTTASTDYCYPADFEECVSVTAVDASGANASFSDYNDAKDISAYGVDIVTTSADGGYASISGTSAASPQVAAAAALLWAADSTLTADEVVSALTGTADAVTGNKHSSSGSAGILNALAAIESVTGVETEQTGADASSDEDQSSSGVTNVRGSESTANSFRYSNGMLLSNPITDSSLISTLSSAYSTWKSSYGTSYYGIVSGSSTKKVAVSDVVRVGIDVSHHNGDIDWEKVAAAGIDYAIIRCGYGSDYESQDDTEFLDNVEGALDAGLEIGIYIYSYAKKATGSAPSAASEAEHVLRLLEEAGLDPEDLDYPIYYDLEDSSQESLSAKTLGNIAETFCDALEAEGYSVGIYANLNWWTNYLTDSRFSSEGWYKWVARYPTSSSVTDCGVDDADMWQFTSSGSVSGVSGTVDVNFDYNPGAPTISSASLSSSYDSITLKWTEVSNADGYEIWRAQGSGDYTLLTTIESGSTLKYKDTDIAYSTKYSYEVRAYYVNSSGEYVYGNYSNVKSVTSRPSKVTLSSVSLSSSLTKATIKWTAVSNITGYEIYRSEDDGENYTKVATVTDSSAVSYSDSTLSLDKTYLFKVRAYYTDSNGNTVRGAFSSAKSVTTKPSKVTLSSVTLSSSLTSATIKWSKVSNAAGYAIYRKTGDGSYTKIATVSGNSTVKYTDKTLKLGKTYTYKVRAYQTSGSTTAYSAYSSTKSVTTKPSKVTISSAATTTSGGIKVTWKKTSNAKGYVIYRSVNGGSYSKVKTITSNTTLSWTDTSVSAGKVYRYKIKSYQKSGSTTVSSASYSSVKKVTAKPAKVSITSITSTKSRSGTVKWKKVSGATGYQVAYRIKGTSKWYYTTVTTNKKVFTLLRNKNYYVKVRAYKTYNGTKYYGPWSSEKAMKVK